MGFEKNIPPPGHDADRVSILRLENGALANTYNFTLNPTSLEWSREANWVDLRAPGTTSNQAMFVNCSNTELTLKFLVARRAVGYQVRNIARKDYGVLPDLAEIESWLLPSLSRFTTNQYEYIPPPTLVLAWGDRVWRCTARAVRVNETIHNARLNPLVAEVEVTFKTHHDSFDDLMATMAVLKSVRDN